MNPEEKLEAIETTAVLLGYYVRKIPGGVKIMTPTKEFSILHLTDNWLGTETKRPTLANEPIDTELPTVQDKFKFLELIKSHL